METTCKKKICESRSYKEDGVKNYFREKERGSWAREITVTLVKLNLSAVPDAN